MVCLRRASGDESRALQRARAGSSALPAQWPPRNMPAVNVHSSFPLDLRRIARSRGARLLVCALALLLAATNVMAAVMPLAGHAVHGPSGAHSTLPHASRAHCAEHGVTMSHMTQDARPGHGADCPCCGKACACVHACDGLVLAMPTALSMPSTRVFAIAPPRDGAAIETPLLRPPIA